MVARVVGRSRLTGLRRNGLVFHILFGSANEDAEQYFQLARLRELFDLDNCTGSDLDERAAEVDFDGTLGRIGKNNATSFVVYSRQTTVGTIPIAVGSFAGAADTQGTIQFKTTAVGSILAGNTTSGMIPIVAVTAGKRANVAAGAINKMITRIPGATGVTNPAKVDNGIDKEEDPVYLKRVRAHQQALSRATVLACETVAAETALVDGSRVRYAKLIEPVIPNGRAVIYIDDGTGALDVYSDEFITTPETVIASAAGGETRTRLSKFAIRDDGSFVLKKNAVTMTRDVDYFLRRDSGEIGFAVALVAADQIKATYRHYTGLVYEAQKRIIGDPSDRVNYPGYAAAATEMRVLPAVRLLQSVIALLSVLPNFDITLVTAAVASAIQSYINTLGISDSVQVFDINGAVKAVPGVKNFTLTDLSGSVPPIDQIIAEGSVARVLATAISVQ